MSQYLLSLVKRTSMVCLHAGKDYEFRSACIFKTALSEVVGCLKEGEGFWCLKEGEGF